jgi:hypothetical protein
VPFGSVPSLSVVTARRSRAFSGAVSTKRTVPPLAAAHSPSALRYRAFSVSFAGRKPPVKPVRYSQRKPAAGSLLQNRVLSRWTGCQGSFDERAEP